MSGNIHITNKKILWVIMLLISTNFIYAQKNDNLSSRIDDNEKVKVLFEKGLKYSDVPDSLISYHTEALILAQKLNLIDYIEKSELSLSKTYAQNQKFDLAYEHLINYNKIKSTNSIANKDFEIDNLKQESNRALNDLNQKVKNVRRESFIAMSSSILIFIILFISFIIIYKRRLTKKYSLQTDTNESIENELIESSEYFDILNNLNETDQEVKDLRKRLKDINWQLINDIKVSVKKLHDRLDNLILKDLSVKDVPVRVEMLEEINDISNDILVSTKNIEEASKITVLKAENKEESDLISFLIHKIPTEK